jgi:hypothetical protein
MNTPRTPDSVFQEIARLRHGPNGPYYNHQCYENGRNVSRYVPADQVAALREDLQSFRRFEQLVGEYTQLMVERTRAEREAGSKKKQTPNSSWPKTRKSNRS